MLLEADDVFDVDVLVIGGGGAGGRAAIEADEYGANTLLIVRGIYGKSGCSVTAKGGFAVPEGHDHEGDSWKQMFYDTLVSGELMNNQKIVEIHCKEAGKSLRELEYYGAMFDRTKDGQRYYGRQMGGHSYRRAVCSGDRAGYELMTGLVRETVRRDIPVLEEVMATSLLRESGKVVGATALNIRNGDFYVIKAKSTIMATGGAGDLFAWRTCSVPGKVGDGVALAYHAGAELSDMEFFQFFPTGTAWPPVMHGTALSESIRGEGGRLYNKYGERFMLKYSPRWREVATRDFVYRCIWKEVVEGRGTPHGGAWLSIAHLPDEQIRQRLPTTIEYGQMIGVDVFKEPFEVTPVAHYMMGGINVNEKTEATVPGLYAAGEVMSGVHGANRLGTTSLPDLITFGRIAGAEAAKRAREISSVNIDVKQANAEKERLFKILSNRPRRGGISPQVLTRHLQEVTFNKVGPARNEKRLKEAIAEFQRVRREDLPLLKLGSDTEIVNKDWVDAITLYWRCDVGEIMARAALMRTESRGGHFREDYPDRDDKNWLKNIVVYKDRSGAMKLVTRPVVVTLLTIDQIEIPTIPIPGKPIPATAREV